MRVAWSSSGTSAMRTCDTTAPFFCASPVMSSTLQPLPSRCAAMPSSAPIVTTPVPPMPVTRMPYGLVGARYRWRGQSREIAALRLLGLAQRAAFDRHEARAKAVDARIILVARRLVDRALAAELGVHRRHRHAVGLHAAIAAAFAHEFVDDDALGGVGELAALAAAPLFRRARLVVEQHRDAGDVAQFALHGVEFVAVMDVGCRRRNSRTDTCRARR